MDDRKIAFITCVRDVHVYAEAKLYLEHLAVPEGMQVEYIPVFGAVSMAAGYNTGMQQTDARYKVYLHEDVLLLHREFITDILRLFQKYPELAVLGVIGSQGMPENGVWWDSPALYGRILHAYEPEALIDSSCGQPEGDYAEAMAVDGVLLATQWDIPWREDIFDGWHFYDVSICAEAYRCGYKAGIAYQEDPWCMHVVRQKPLPPEYWRYRDVFLREYGTAYDVIK